MAATYDLEWLLGVLERAAWIDTAQRRDIEVRAGQQRARLLMQLFGNAEAASRARYRVGPGELVASFDLEHVDGGRLDEERIAALVA
ncbi:MAG: hypothetical protein AAB426_12060, partial [Myxococcota bacterium]